MTHFSGLHNEFMGSAAGVAWDLTVLFTSMDDPSIATTWSESGSLADTFAEKYRGKVEAGALSAAELATALKELEDLTVLVSKPVIYAHLMFAADTSNPKNGAFLQEQTEKASEIRIKLMFFDLELQAADQAWVDSCLADPVMANYVHHVQTSRVYSPHRLTEVEERLLEETSNVGSRAWTRLHEEVLSNHTFIYVDPTNGGAQDLSETAVLHLLRDGDRNVRQAAADSLSKGLTEVSRVVTFLYNTLLADKKLEDRLRKFEYPEQSRHMANELSKEVVDTVTTLCKERSDLVARYYRIKRQILGLDELTHIDRYAPLFEAKGTADWEEARKIVLESFAAFSPTMSDKAGEFFDKNWIDAEPRNGKRGGAFCMYVTPDTHPYILMSYQGSMDDVMTLAHELGHGVHASLSREQTEFNFHGTLPLAELASIFGEMLVFEKIVDKADLKDKVALYAQKIEGIFASVHRQAAMYRFEQRCHTHRREKGELSTDDFNAIWQEEMQSMFQDSVNLGDQHAVWWSYIGHFIFAPFYVYAYAFGELLTLAIYQMAKEEGPSFADKYVDVLKLGGSQTPQELMGQLGVDLADRKFWEGGFAAIENLVTRFEELWAEYKG